MERELSQFETQAQQHQQKLVQVKESLSLLNRLIPQMTILLDETLFDRVETVREEMSEAQEAARFLQQHGNALAKLEPLVSVLQSDPQQHEQLQKDYETAETEPESG